MATNMLEEEPAKGEQGNRPFTQLTSVALIYTTNLFSKLN